MCLWMLSLRWIKSAIISRAGSVICFASGDLVLLDCIIVNSFTTMFQLRNLNMFGGLGSSEGSPFCLATKFKEIFRLAPLKSKYNNSILAIICWIVNLRNILLLLPHYRRLQYNTIRYDTIRYDTIQYNTIQYNTHALFSQFYTGKWNVMMHSYSTADFLYL